MWKPTKKTTLRGAAVVAAALAFPVLNATAAQAIDWDHSMLTDDQAPGGRVRFEAYGDIVEVCDIEPDGWAVEVTVEAGNYFDRFTIGGEGNCKTHRASNGHNLTEGKEYRFSVSLYKSSTSSHYEDYAFWTA
ncbi:hypothetical protein [Streptomyces sp. NPDC049881]|uniref:hypothetical protein n=1 Tax=unclassified Streptomyces TaxID=2593676 RepID=UPI00343BA972